MAIPGISSGNEGNPWLKYLNYQNQNNTNVSWPKENQEDGNVSEVKVPYVTGKFCTVTGAGRIAPTTGETGIVLPPVSSRVDDGNGNLIAEGSSHGRGLRYMPESELKEKKINLMLIA